MGDLRSRLTDRLPRSTFLSNAINRHSDKVLTRPEIILLAASFIAVLIFTCVGIQRWVFVDEANSVLIALRGPSGIISSLAVDNNLPLYCLFLWVWTSLFGISEIALRLPSVFFYLVTCGLVYLLAVRICGSHLSGIYAFLLFACSSQAIHQAQKIRMYSLLGCLSALSVLLWFVLFQEKCPSRPLFFLFTTMNAIGLLTHIYFGFVMAAEIAACVSWLEWKQVRRMAYSVLIAASVFGILWGRIFWAQLHSPAGEWTPGLDYWLVSALFSQVYGRGGTVLIAVGLASILWSGRRRLVSSPFLRPSLASLATIVGISYLLPLAISVRRPIVYPDRYTIAELPALTVLLAAVIHSAGQRSRCVWLLSSLMVISVSTHILTREDNPEARSVSGALTGGRAVSSWLLKRLRPGDAVVFSGLSRASIDYYFLRDGAGGRFFEVSYPRSIDEHLGWRNRHPAATDWDGLSSEAAALVDRLMQGPAQESRIWLVYDHADGQSDVLKTELDRRFKQESATAKQASMLTAIYSYCCIPAVRHE